MILICSIVSWLVESLESMQKMIIFFVQQRQGGDAAAAASGWGRGRGLTDISRNARVADGFREETTYSVPAEKCGLVIGKG